MLELSEAVRAHLEQHGTLIVPTRQRAAAVRLAHSAVMLASGRRTWPSPDVLTFRAWLERELDRARTLGTPVPRRLAGVSEWLLWRDAVLHAAESTEILAPERLVDVVRAAATRLEDYGLAPAASDSAEMALLLAAREHFRASCERLRALSSGSWRACAPYVQPTARVMLAGFSAVGTALRHWLGQGGAVVQAPQAGDACAQADAGRIARCSERPGHPVQLVCAPTPAAEAQAAAEWCARQLVLDPAARLLVVVPRLAEQRHLWQRALSQRLDYEAILASPAAGSARPAAYAIEGGQPLATFPLVAAALGVIDLGADRLEFESLSALLRSPYLPAWDGALRVRLDVWLREQNLDVAARETLAAVCARIARELEPAVAQLLHSLLSCTDQPAGSGAAGTSPGGAGDGGGSVQAWARQFATWLGAAGWPGADLASEELQVCTRFDELLGDLAVAEAARAPLTLSEAVTLLRELAARSAFEPASDDVAVTVTAALEDPIVCYDGIWVAGLTAEAWPAVVQPDALLPLPLQYSAGLPQASAEGQLQRARQLQRLWAASARRCVLSWPVADGDLLCDPSPLLRELAIEPASACPEPPPGGPFTERWLAGLSPPLTAWRDSAGPPWLDSGLPGGARLLELQALCPFRGFAELRLAAHPLPLPAAGIDARWRGQILHRVLELFWREMADQRALQGCGRQERLARVQRYAALAIAEVAQEKAVAVQPQLLQQERERTATLVMRVLDWEVARPPFVIQALEEKRRLLLTGGTLRLRLDRIDQLEDGSLLVIDYKSGQAKSFDALAGRLTQPQLPAYALVAGDTVAAVLALHAGPQALRVRGVADAAGRIRRLGGLPPGMSWSQLRTRWSGQLQQLVQEFVTGHAAVDPQPHACSLCHLHALCRIDAQAPGAAAALAAEEAGAERTDENGENRESGEGSGDADDEPGADEGMA